MKASDNPFARVIHTLRTSNPSTPADSSWNTFAKADGIYAQSSNAVVGPFSSGGGETLVGVASSTSAFSTSSTTFTDLTGITVTGTTGAHRCRVQFIGNVSNDTVGSWTAVTLLIDGTNVQGGSLVWMAVGTSRGANDIYNVSFTFLSDVLTAASHTFKIQMRVSGNTGKIREEGTYRIQVTETQMTS